MDVWRNGLWFVRVLEVSGCFRRAPLSLERQILVINQREAPIYIYIYRAGWVGEGSSATLVHTTSPLGVSPRGVRAGLTDVRTSICDVDHTDTLHIVNYESIPFPSGMAMIRGPSLHLISCI